MIVLRKETCHQMGNGNRLYYLEDQTTAEEMRQILDEQTKAYADS